MNEQQKKEIIQTINEIRKEIGLQPYDTVSLQEMDIEELKNLYRRQMALKVGRGKPATKLSFNMKKLLVLIFPIVIVFTIVYFFISPHLSITDQLDNETIEREWHFVESFSGTGNKTTDQFYIPGKKLRMTTLAELEPKGSLHIHMYSNGKEFGAIFYSEGLSCRGKTFTNSINDTKHADSGQANFYLKIVTEDVKNWSIKIESLY